MTDAELFERMGPEDDPFEPEECQPEYPLLPEGCDHHAAYGVQDRDGTFYMRCPSCGLEF